ncbi:MAG: HPr family phosphocarrier protein [Alphaproteobacteria bacterium]|nr:HPr family phosphocarrier protein [Alphaproteobacteria bacterium]
MAKAKTDRRRGPVLRTKVTVANRRGLHARAAAKFVKTVAAHDAEVRVTVKGNTVSGASIMGLMMLGAGAGTALVLRATGAAAAAVLVALQALIAARFDEDE